MTNRKRSHNQSPKSPQPESNENGSTVQYLPPERKGKTIRKVSPPLYKSTRLSTLIYVLILLTALLSAYYGWRVVQYKSAVGGWWSLLLGRKPVNMMHGGTGESTHTVIHQGAGKGRNQGELSVEGHIKGLAEALGMPTAELAAAIAAAVRAYVPPASLSSIKAQETGEAVRVMLENPGKGEEAPLDPNENEDGHHGGVVEGIVEGFDKFVGMDEP